MALVSFGDILDLSHKIRIFGLKYLQKLFRIGYTSKVKAHWDGSESPPTHWWHVPEIHLYWNKLITGDRIKSYFEHVISDYMHNKKKYYSFIRRLRGR